MKPGPEALVAVRDIADGKVEAPAFFLGPRSKTVWSSARWTSRKNRDRVRIGRPAPGRTILKSVPPDTLVRLEAANE